MWSAGPRPALERLRRTGLYDPSHDSNFFFRDRDSLNLSTGFGLEDQSWNMMVQDIHLRPDSDRNSIFTTVSDASSRPSVEYCELLYVPRVYFSCIYVGLGPALDYSQRQNAMLWLSFSYLDTKSLARCGAVCKQWYHISRHPSLWRRLQIKDVEISAANLKLFGQWCTDVGNIHGYVFMP